MWAHASAEGRDSLFVFLHKRHEYVSLAIDAVIGPTIKVAYDIFLFSGSAKHRAFSRGRVSIVLSHFVANSNAKASRREIKIIASQILASYLCAFDRERERERQIRATSPVSFRDNEATIALQTSRSRETLQTKPREFSRARAFEFVYLIMH